MSEKRTESRESNLVEINQHALWWYRDGRREVGEGPVFDQYTMAKQTGVSRSYISDIEQGTRSPRPLVAMALARALGVTIEDLTDPDPRFEERRWTSGTKAALTWQMRQREKRRQSLKSST